MTKLLLTTAMALSLSACVVSGHPSTDRSHSHVDNSSSRYYSDGVDRHYDAKDRTKYKYNKYQADKRYRDDDYPDDDYYYRADYPGDRYYNEPYNGERVPYKRAYRYYE